MSSPFVPRSTASDLPPLQSVIIAGAGVIGLSIALELHHRGIAVSVLDSGTAMKQASTAAAGMLAVEDPHNPPEILEFSHYSRSLYPAFLERLGALSGLPVLFQTRVCNQYLPNGSHLRLDEVSIDPRQLATSLLAAVSSAGIDLREGGTEPFPRERLNDRTLVIAAGAWSGMPDHPVSPRKGQMLRVALPPSLASLSEVHRAEHIYIVPRTQGPQAGTALIGATVEEAGFDTTVHDEALEHLRALAAELLPELASEANAPTVEAWAGLRPATPDGLPTLGRLGDRIVATGHFRNGILLAPATAHAVADMIEGRQPVADISAFTPERFAR